MVATIWALAGPAGDAVAQARADEILALAATPPAAAAAGR